MNSSEVGHDHLMGRYGTRPYADFVNELKAAVFTPTGKDIPLFLDGLASQECLRLVRLKSIQRLGAFFTPSAIAERIISKFEVTRWTDEVVFDPACGAGDLILPVARRLPVRSTLSATLRLWNDHIFGCDISPEFIEASRLRLALLAAYRGSRLDISLLEIARILSNLVVADGLQVSDAFNRSSCIVMNPPYGRVDMGKLSWREGAVTAAALFVERAARLCAPRAQIAALLPEVLRTGSSYRNWRDHVAGFVAHSTPESIGLFSHSADVDVFVQHYRKNHQQKPEKSTEAPGFGVQVSDHFYVNVGAVVPYRDPQKGVSRAYLHPRNAKPWKEIRRISEMRKFEGRTFSPPFVVVRRTSRPGDRHRAVASLVLGRRPVAVENHLLVLSPRTGGLDICRRLIALLREPTISNLLDQTIRCRHLTTASVSSLPWS